MLLTSILCWRTPSSGAIIVAGFLSSTQRIASVTSPPETPTVKSDNALLIDVVHLHSYAHLLTYAVHLLKRFSAQDRVVRGVTVIAAGEDASHSKVVQWPALQTAIPSDPLALRQLNYT